MARKVNAGPPVYTVPAMDVLRIHKDSPLSAQMTDGITKMPADKLIDILDKILKNAEKEMTPINGIEANLENANLLYFRVIKILGVIQKSHPLMNFNTHPYLKVIMEKSIKQVEYIERQARNYHNEHPLAPSSFLGESDEEAPPPNVDNNEIKPKDLYILYKKDTEILILDVREKRHGQIEFPNMSRVQIVKIEHNLLNKQHTFKHFMDSIGAKEKASINAREYDIVIIAGSGEGGVDTERQDCLKQVISYNNYTYSSSWNRIKLLEGGYKNWELIYPAMYKEFTQYDGPGSQSDHVTFLKMVSKLKETRTQDGTYPNLDLNKENEERMDEGTPYVHPTPAASVLSSYDNEFSDYYSSEKEKPMPAFTMPPGRDEMTSPPKKRSYVPRETSFPVTPTLPPRPSNNVIKPTPLTVQKPQIPSRGLKGPAIAKQEQYFKRLTDIYQAALSDIESRSVRGGVVRGGTGFQNMGNTCFMSATLQALLHTDKLNLLFTYDRLHKIVNNDNIHGTQGVISAVYASLVAAYWSGSFQVIVPENFLVTFKEYVNESLADRQQHDAHEFHMFLVDSLHEDTNQVTQRVSFEQNYTGYDLVADYEDYALRSALFARSEIGELFNSRIVVHLKCKKCGTTSVTFEDSPQIQVQMPSNNMKCAGGARLNDCLKSHFDDSVLEDGWKCAKCKVVSPASRDVKIWKLPTYLVIQLKRFEYDGIDYSKNEIFCQFDIKCLNMAPFLHPHSKTYNKSITNYELYSVTNHKGTLRAGHYYSYTKNDGNWSNYNDSRVTEIPENHLCGEAAYILYYKLTNQPTNNKTN
uniref:Ubiquitin carboxyl-terminal hydrolase n=1 Tax=Rhabditophanes sp. KR3021 TaxID=114890 RepID=A0AC35TGP1_9BILA